MMSKNPIALQLYTLRNEIAEDYGGTLRAVAELGYQAVELATLGNYSAAELRSELDALGLQAVSAHISLDRLENQLDQEIDDAHTLGVQYIVCPWLPPHRRDSASYHEIARALNGIGQSCKDQGLQLCYHNHEFEFQPFDGTTGFEILFKETDPSLVQAELDVYWVAFAGLDPAALLRSMRGRVPLVHVKDMAADETRTFAEVGSGVLDIPGILSAADEIDAEWLIVEQDRCARPPLASVGMSLAYLRSIGRA